MSALRRGERDSALVDDLVRQITGDAHGDDEKLQAFRQAFEDHAAAPCDGFVVGEPISVIAFDYDGNERRGLTARCRHRDGTEHVVAACDVELPPHTEGGRRTADGWGSTRTRQRVPSAGGLAVSTRQCRLTLTCVLLSNWSPSP